MMWMDRNPPAFGMDFTTLVMARTITFVCNLTWQWNILLLNRKYILKWVHFPASYVSLPECINYLCETLGNYGLATCSGKFTYESLRMDVATLC